MAKTDTKTVSIVLLLYFLVISGLILYIISKYREEYTRCNIINKNTKDNISKITAGDNIKYDTIVENDVRMSVETISSDIATKRSQVMPKSITSSPETQIFLLLFIKVDLCFSLKLV